MVLVADMETVIEDTQFGDPAMKEAINEADTDSWCRCPCYCKDVTSRTSAGIELMAGLDFGK